MERGKDSAVGWDLLCKSRPQAWTPIIGTGKSVAATIRHAPWTMATCWGCWKMCRHTGRRQLHCPRNRWVWTWLQVCVLLIKESIGSQGTYLIGFENMKHMVWGRVLGSRRW